MPTSLSITKRCDENNGDGTVIFKKIEEMDFYEILDVNKSASQQEIRKAYLLGLSAYSQNSMAHYTLVSEEERENMLLRIKKAFEVLGNPDKRKEYDEKTFRKPPLSKNPLYYRQYGEKMVIEDAGRGRQFIRSLKRFFFSSKKK